MQDSFYTLVQQDRVRYEVSFPVLYADNKGIRVITLIGNHDRDRILFMEKDNWLSVLLNEN